MLILRLTLNYSVPQGSVSGANLFTAYCAPIESIIPAGITINGFTDDHSIRKSFIADSRDQENQSISMLMETVGTICLLDGYYPSEIKSRQD